MTLSMDKPHAKLFHAVFSDAEEAASVLQAYLPEKLAAKIDWSTLTFQNKRFVDEDFRESESDLVFLARFKDSKTTVYLHFLFEHQSTPDKWIRFRLLKYKCRIWDESFKVFKEQGGLLQVLPIVLYQGKTPWNYSTKFSDLYRHKLDDMSFAVDFDHFLVDLSGYGNEEFKGELKARIAQLLMKAAFHGRMREMYEMLSDMISRLPQGEGFDYVGFFIRYVFITQERETYNELAKTMNKYSEKIGGDMISAAEAYWREGIKEGELKSKMEIIQNLLTMGSDWNVIFKATGVDQAGFQKLKEKWSSLELAAS